MMDNLGSWFSMLFYSNFSIWFLEKSMSLENLKETHISDNMLENVKGPCRWKDKDALSFQNPFQSCQRFCVDYTRFLLKCKYSTACSIIKLLWHFYYRFSSFALSSRKIIVNAWHIEYLEPYWLKMAYDSVQYV